MRKDALYVITVTEGPVCIAHQLHLPYESKCNELHGHNYIVEATVSALRLNQNGMVADFTTVKAAIKKYDHSFLGDLGQTRHGFIIEKHFAAVEPSTAEHFAQVLFQDIADALSGSSNGVRVVMVSVWETPNNKVTYTES